MVPDALRGRVMAVYSMMFMGMAPFGALLAGTLADASRRPATVAIGGIACIIAALVFGWRLPTLPLRLPTSSSHFRSPAGTARGNGRADERRSAAGIRPMDRHNVEARFKTR